MSSINTAPHPQKKIKRRAIGTFQKMGLHSNLLRAIQQMGYRLPTPIQRKSIPTILDGHDIIAMARTGSGKSAAFLIPLISNLESHSTRIGCRGLILSPTRDLALQTAKFAKQLCKYTDLRICVIIGGESVEEQFNGLSYNPDILIGTPGRISYLLKEISTFNLHSCKYLIFDECDKLFEMGFAIQIKNIVNNINNSNLKQIKPQTMLFSATIPSNIKQFTRANLINPIIIRLDTEIKVSPNLSLDYIYSSGDNINKLGILLYLLQSHTFINNICNTPLILIFAATKYYVELLYEFLIFNGFKCVLTYGTMEQLYRKEMTEKFYDKNNNINIMITTDLASRGIDIPLLDYVINYQISQNIKTFVHRVGRVARNGKYGKAINIISNDELPYMCDIKNYIGKQDNNFGIIPQSLLLQYNQTVNHIFTKHEDIKKMFNLCQRSMEMYNKTKMKPSKNGIKCSKKMNIKVIHPMVKTQVNKKELAQYKMLDDVSQWKSKTTVFEIGGGANPGYKMMRKRRHKYDDDPIQSEKVNYNTGKIKVKKSYKSSEYFIDNNKKENDLDIEEECGDKLKQFIMELDDDEMKIINKKKKLYRYSGSNNKYVTEYFGDRINRFMSEKNESANVINNNRKRYGKLYKEWQLKSKREIGLNGSYERDDVNYENDRKVMGYRKYRYVRGTNEYHDNVRAKKRIVAIRNENNLKDKNRKDKIKKFKRERFRKWWTNNKDRVKGRKAGRKRRGY